MGRRVPLEMVASRDLVQKMLAVGREFDMDKGGTMDARSGCVNFWCTQEDHPECWPTIRGGQVVADYVCSLFWSYNAQTLVYDLFLDLSPYALKDSKPRARGRDEWAAISEEEWARVLKWSKVQVWNLIRLAQMHEAILGTKCPFCSYVHPVGELLNGLIDHVVKDHGEVQSIVLGGDTKIQVDGAFHVLQNKTDME